MKKFILVLSILALVTMACATLSGGGDEVEVPMVDDSGEDVSEPAPADDDDGDGDMGGSDSGEMEKHGDSPFPLPEKYENLMADETSANFQTPGTIDELVDFYRAELIDKAGLTERDLLTVISDSTVSMVFDGHSSGMAVVVQMVDLGSGSTNVNIRFEDV
jgi:predicted small secreted protein